MDWNFTLFRIELVGMVVQIFMSVNEAPWMNRSASQISELDSRRYVEHYPISIPRTVQPGQYKLEFKLYSNDEEKDVFVALDPKLLDKENYYSVAAVNVNKFISISNFIQFP